MALTRHPTKADIGKIVYVDGTEEFEWLGEEHKLVFDKVPAVLVETDSAMRSVGYIEDWQEYCVVNFLEPFEQLRAINHTCGDAPSGMRYIPWLSIVWCEELTFNSQDLEAFFDEN